MASIFKGAETGGEIGSLFGPTGEVVGAGLGGIIGAATTLVGAEGLRHRRPRRPVPHIDPHQSGGSDLAPRGTVVQVGGRSQLMQPIEQKESTQPVNTGLINPRLLRARHRVGSNIRTITGLAGAAAVSAGIAASGGSTRVLPPPGGTVLPPPKQAGPEETKEPATTPSETVKTPIIPPVTTTSIPLSRSTIDRQVAVTKARAINYRLPTFGVYNLERWRRATINNTIAMLI